MTRLGFIRACSRSHLVLDPPETPEPRIESEQTDWRRGQFGCSSQKLLEKHPRKCEVWKELDQNSWGHEGNWQDVRLSTELAIFSAGNTDELSADQCSMSTDRPWLIGVLPSKCRAESRG